MNIASFSELRHGLSQLPGPDEAAAAAARARQAQLTKPAGSMGRLEDVAVFFAAWQGKEIPAIAHPQAVIFAGNHGVAARGVSAYPSEVTVQMVANFKAGGAAINQLCTLAGVTLDVIALDLDNPTQDFTQGPAMTEAECLQAFNTGIASIPEACDVLILGEMGIGNTTSAAAITCVLTKRAPQTIAGPGTGLAPEKVRHKAAVIEEAIAFHGTALTDAAEVLRRLGGREIAALAGAIFGARLRRIPVLLDGFVVTAAAATLQAVNPQALSHCLAGHLSAEPAHALLLEHLGLTPLLALNMRLGEGSGAAVALSVVRAALATHAGMATFASAGVSTQA